MRKITWVGGWIERKPAVLLLGKVFNHEKCHYIPFESSVFCFYSMNLAEKTETSESELPSPPLLFAL